MVPTDALGWVILIVLAYVALRVGALVLKVLVGLLAIGLVVWLLRGLFTGAGAAGSSLPWG